jgi:hypothetical protein
MRTGLLTAIAIAAVAFSGAAQASVVTETFNGLITSGIDNAGTFGAAGASFAGDSVTFSFSYDTGLLQAAVNAGTNGSAEYLNPPDYDLYFDYAGDSAFTESVTINSQTLTIANSASNSGYAFFEGCTAAQCGGDGLLASKAQIGSGAYIETVVNTTQNYSVGDDLLNQTEVDALVGGGVTTGEITISDGGSPDTLEISNVSELPATPEPTTWISLALGFGMVGLLKRRRGAR